MIKVVKQFTAKSGIKIVLLQKNAKCFYSTFIPSNVNINDVLDTCWEVNRYISSTTGKTTLKWQTYPAARRRYNQMLRNENYVNFKVLTIK